MSDRLVKWLALGAILFAVVLAWMLLAGDAPDASEAPRPPARDSSDDVDAPTQPDVSEPPSIAGVVRSREQPDEPIPNARVCAWRLGAQERVIESLATRCVIAGDDGRYRLRELDPGRYRLGASAIGRLPAIWTDPERADVQVLSLAWGEARTDVDLALVSGGQPLGGVVVDVSGGPIERALVVASGPGMFAQQPVATAISDEQGRFSMWVAGGEYSLRAVASGYAPTMHRAQAPNQKLELRLVPESVLIGRVVDAASGEGIASAQVTIDARWSSSASVLSSDDGSFRIGGLAPGIYQPEAIAPGLYGRASSPVHVGLGQTSAPIELRVHPAHRLRGQIVAVDRRLPASEQQRGCAGGHVRLSGAGVVRGGEADDEGWVTLEGVPPGRHDLRVSCPEQFEALEQRLELRGDLDDQRWELEVGGIHLAGRAVDARGRGVEGVYVDSTGPGGDSHNMSMVDGEFTLRVREPGTHRITAKLRGQREPVATLELAVGDRPIAGIELVVGEVASVRGRVEDSRGQPVGGFRVALCDAQGKPRLWATTDGEGRFAFDGQAPGRWWIAFSNELDPSSDEPAGEPVELSADRVAEIVRAIEIETGSIRGTVTAEGGPVDDAWIVAGRGSIDSLVDGGEIGPILSDVDGTFVLDSLGEGTWAIRAFRKQGGEASVADVELGSTVELDLHATASVAGRVQHRDGTAPAHFEIQASSGERRRDHAFYRSEGAFELAELPAGKWTLMVVAESGSAELEVELDPGQRLADLTIELERRVTIRGRAVDSRTGAAVSTVAISHQYSSGFRREAVPDKLGSFELEGVPPGRVELIVTPRDFLNAPHSIQGVVLDVATEPLVQDVGELALAGGKLEPDQSPGELGFEFRIVGLDRGLEHIDECHVEVTKVVSGGPAAIAGLRTGDVITRFDGASIEGRRAAHMGIYMRRVAAGAAIELERRNASSVTIVAAPLAN